MESVEVNFKGISNLKAHVVMDKFGNVLDGKMESAKELYDLIREVKGFHETIVQINVCFESVAYTVCSQGEKIFVFQK
jgi:hypothetical protein